MPKHRRGFLTQRGGKRASQKSQILGWRTINLNNSIDEGEQVYYFNESTDMDICAEFEGEGIYSLDRFCSEGVDDCFTIAGSASYNSCEQDGCGCSIEIICGEGGAQTINGEIVNDYISSQSYEYDCPELCYDGYFCVRRVDCDFSNSSHPELGIQNLDIKMSMETSFDPNGDEECETEFGGNTVTGCRVKYQCGDEEVIEFCHPEPCYGDISGIYNCQGEFPPTPCGENVTPVVIENRSQGTDSLGREVVRTDFAIVPDNAFRISSVFPNPFSQQLTIKLTASYAGNAQVNLVNLLGQVVHTERHEFIRGYTPIQVSTAALGLTPGLYQVVVTDELGNYFTEKIMYQP